MSLIDDYLANLQKIPDKKKVFQKINKIKCGEYDLPSASSIFD